MKLAIIGTGNVGKGLATAFSGTEHSVTFGGRDAADAKKTASTLSDKLGRSIAGDSVAAAVADADTIFLAVPYEAVPAVLKAANDWTGKTVVDVTNPMKADFSGLSLGFDTSAAEEIQRQTDAIVVKGFNTVFAQIYAEGPVFGNHAVSVFLASDDDKAKASIADLATAAGFEAVDAGPLSSARNLEPLAALNIYLAYGKGLGTQRAPVFIER